MLYLNSIENAEDSPTEQKYAICHEEVSSMLNIPELAPSRELLAQWESQEISWKIFRKKFIEEMKAEYLRNEMSRLKGLAKYALENDVTLYSPEPSGERNYRSILEGIINQIWKSQGLKNRVINRAREPVEEAQPIEVKPQPKVTIAQEEIAKLVSQILPEVASAKDDEIQLIKENAELKARIQSLQDESGNKDRENTKLKRQVDQLKEDTSTKEGEIKSLEVTIRNAHRENTGLKTKIAQLQDIKTHPGLRKVAVKATRDNPVVFGKDFRTLDIDNDLPINLREWLVEALREVLKTNQSSSLDLDDLIRTHTNFNVKYTLSGKFDKYDAPLAHVIRTQRHLIAHPDMMDERTKMARVLCCFFAAALLSPKLSKSDHTSAEPPKSIKPKLNDAETHYKRGVTYQKKGDYDRAIAEYTKAIKLNPDYTSAYYNRGTAYYYKSNYDGVIADLTKVIELDPDNANAYYDRAIAYCRKNYYVRAITDLTKVIELKPGNVNAYYNRGHAYQQNGDHTRAQADFDKATQLKK